MKNKDLRMGKNTEAQASDVLSKWNNATNTQTNKQAAISIEWGFSLLLFPS